MRSALLRNFSRPAITSFSY